MNRRRSRASERARRTPGGPPSQDRNTPHRGKGQLRLIGGRFRRRQLPIPDSPGLRPTPDRVRETLFNWLAFELPGRRVLDLFAGTGALGLEALSRGAGQVTFVESMPAVAEALATNLKTLDAEGEIQTATSADFLARPPSPFDIVFLDPPFRQGLAEATCECLEQRGWLAPDAMIYVETEHTLDWQPPAGWHLHREVRAGDSHGRLFRRHGDSG
ncbi:16S rRNA (guanine(966)-N(2))-methyltransferase RsmD [Salinicola avicenniae]|uniref:16S rRNA (guanine(966)-N(2))-methyltransferase RsmD n=1 Tax=Salinicola avicenniae TaxID=2916836 RepID=UPI002072DC23|nr:MULTISPECIES: 16S rRNA (guanine(966)-N(2))-methyltransferase RsmD [unclassified Salinicola]